MTNVASLAPLSIVIEPVPIAVVAFPEPLRVRSLNVQLLSPPKLPAPLNEKVPPVIVITPLPVTLPVPPWAPTPTLDAPNNVPAETTRSPVTSKTALYVHSPSDPLNVKFLNLPVVVLSNPFKLLPVVIASNVTVPLLFVYIPLLVQLPPMVRLAELD